MRYPPDHKERTRRHIVETASRALRRDGIAATSIVPLMRELGMTQGAFYKNFAGRDAVLLEALQHALGETRRFVMQWVIAARDAGEPPIVRIIEEYLSERHLDNREHTCVIAAIGPELWRQSDALRRQASQSCEQMFEVVAVEMPADRRALVRPLYLMMAGVISCARLEGTREEQLALLSEGRVAARILAGIVD